MKRTAVGITLALLGVSCDQTTTPPVPAAGDPVAVVRVLDGDSLVVEVGSEEVDVRLLGINAPERDECFDSEAKARAGALAADGVRLAGADQDRFGRWLRYAYTSDGTLINQQLVAEGLALALTNDHPLLDEFKTAEADAFGESTGLWQADACGPATDVTVTITDLVADAPGDDAQNPNGEWVDIANGGPAPVALDGWTLRDESSSHRFEFASGFSLPPGEQVRIFSGCGDPSASQLYWCDGDPVWSNQGDSAYLLDPFGNILDRYVFPPQP